MTTSSPPDPLDPLDPSRYYEATVDGERFLLERDSGRSLRLNRTGSVVWDCLRSGGGRAEAVDALVARFEVDAAHAATDVDAFLGRLADVGLLSGDGGTQA